MLALVSTLFWSDPVRGQQSSAAPTGLEEQTRTNAGAPCLEPPPLVSWDEYHGPFQELIGTVAQTLERKAAPDAPSRSGTLLCSLEPKDKFALFVHDAFDPLSFLAAGFNAGIDQAPNRDPTFGQGAEGYGRRFGANFAGQTSLRFFADFAYPAIFSEDPRYYRLAKGSGERRLLHAVEHAFVAHRDNGTHMFNFAEWMGATSSVVLSNAFHPGNENGLGPGTRRVGYTVLTDVGFDILREFWPEIAHKLKMPFHERPQKAIESPTSPSGE